MPWTCLDVGVFAAATFAKAWEPLGVAVAALGVPLSDLPPFAAVLVACEALKLVVATLAIRLSTAGLNGHIYHVSPPKLALLLSRSSAYRFGVPAAFLAATNLLLGYAIPRLDPILYQTLFKAINVLATALFSTLRAPLGPTRWCSLVILLVGSYLALGGGDDQGAATAIVGGHSSDAGSHGAASAHNPTNANTSEGLIATVAGALCMAMQGVWFEHESSASSAMQQDEGIAWQTAALAVWGLLVNLAVLLWNWGAMAGHQLNPWHGFTLATWGAAAGIAAADLTMAAFFKRLGANAYSFSRILAMLLCTALTVAVLGKSLSARFLLGAALVVFSSWLYQRDSETPGTTRSASPGGGHARAARALLPTAVLVGISVVSMLLMIARSPSKYDGSNRGAPPPHMPAGSGGRTSSGATVTPNTPNGANGLALRRRRHENGDTRRRFWHITDVHLNLWHDAHGDVRDMCRSRSDDVARHPGRYGHFNCDPAPRILELTLGHMAAVEPAPSAILLGGDDLGHIPADQEGAAAARRSQRAVAAALRKAFPNTPILPTVGNHDTWPYFTSSGEGAADARRELANLYGEHLAPAQRRHLATRGYYLHKLTRREWVAVLETNALALTEAAADAASQLEWLDRTLTNAAEAGASVIILGHIAPGASHVDFNSMAAAGWQGGGLTAKAQEALYALMRRDAARGASTSEGVSGIRRGPLAALLFGHLHTGSVRLLGNDEHEPENAVVHLSPSLTPRNPTPHTPAVRLYEFSAPTAHAPMALREIYEHRLDLDASNQGADGGLVWREVAVREELNLTGTLASAATWRQWASKLLSDGREFARLMSPQRCADEIDANFAVCRASFVCAALEPQPQPYASCLRVSKFAPTPDGWVERQKRAP